MRKSFDDDHMQGLELAVELVLGCVVFRVGQCLFEVCGGGVQARQEV